MAKSMTQAQIRNNIQKKLANDLYREKKMQNMVRTGARLECDGDVRGGSGGVRRPLAFSGVLRRRLEAASDSCDARVVLLRFARVLCNGDFRPQVGF